MQLHGRAQAADAPAFAVATIKPGKHVTQNAQRPYAGGYSARDVTVSDLIAYAYGLPFGMSGLISGGPKWAYADTFDIEVKAGDDAEGKPNPGLTASQVSAFDRSMVQQFLAARFKLRVHHEAIQVAGFALTIAKSGPRLAHAKDSAPPAENTRTYALGAYLPTPRADPTGLRLTRGDIHAPGVTMDWLAGYLQFQPEMEGHNVSDKTGLIGKFDISLKWSPEKLDASDSPKESSGQTDLFTALREQLGLKLERTKVAADSIVIDSLERPSEN
jgi:uncharacterized protein (TIGR03435 family)